MARAGQRTRRRSRYRDALLALAAGASLATVMLPVDGPLASAAASIGRGLGGDPRRELESLQQFGAAGSAALIAWAIWLLDPARRRRLLDWALAIGLTSLSTFLMKIAIGRPRPRLGEPSTFLGPFGAHPLPGADPPGVYHAWELWAPISSDLWSMPSSHTATAACAAGFLGVLYPRLRPLLIAMIALVGASRLLFGAHYPSDVALGAAIGLACGLAATRGYLGVRLLDWIWRVVVDRTRVPALPGCVRWEHVLRRRRPVAGDLAGPGA